MNDFFEHIWQDSSPERCCRCWIEKSAVSLTCTKKHVWRYYGKDEGYTCSICRYGGKKKGILKFENLLEVNVDCKNPVTIWQRILRDDNNMDWKSYYFTDKLKYTSPPDFSGIDADTGLPWSPRKVIQLLGMTKASDEETRQICQKIIDANPEQVAQYKSGKKNLLGFFMKLVMDATNKRADPKLASRVLQELLCI